MATTEGHVAEFSSFANFEERKRKSNLLMSFPKTVHQKGYFSQIRRNPLFRICRPILDIFGLTLLNRIVNVVWSVWLQNLIFLPTKHVSESLFDDAVGVEAETFAKLNT